MESVSILTPTTINRKNFIKFMAKCISYQDYKNIVEWIIIDGTKDLKSDLELTIKEIEKIKNLPNIKFLKQDLNRNNNIGSLRNILIENSIGDIMIFFDDDDFYFENRISHSVKMLIDSKCDLALCSDMFLYETDFKLIYKFKSYGQYHGLCCTMAFTKNYIKNNRFDNNKSSAEETSFTNGFTNKAIQLDPKSTIIHTSHNSNTFNKKKNIIIENLHLDKNDKRCKVSEFGSSFKNLTKNKDLLNNYLALFNNSFDKSKYDVVIFIGLFNKIWNPSNYNYDEYHDYLLNLSKNLVLKGYKTAVFLNIKDNISIDGVDFLNYSEFKISLKYNIIIISKISSIYTFLKFKNLKYNKLFLDIYENSTFDYDKTLINNLNLFDKIIFKSDFNLRFFLNNIKNDYYKKSILNISNVIDFYIDRNLFINNNCKREEFRFCFTNFYGNGLYLLLSVFFPTIKNIIKNAEFHIYGSINNLNDEYKQALSKLLNQEGVFNHGSVNHKQIIEEKFKSRFHLYYTNSENDCDFKNIYESIYCGCIPILAKNSIFSSCNGLHFDGNPSSPEDHYNCANQLIEMITEKLYLEKKKHSLISNLNNLSIEDFINKYINNF